MKLRIAPQQCHGILQTYIPSVSSCRGLSDALHAARVRAVGTKILFKYLESLNQYGNVNSAATVPRNSTNVYTIRKCLSRAFERNKN